MIAGPRSKPIGGPAILSYGFRPLFFFGACYAALAMIIWLPVYYGAISTLSNFTARDWHVHEMLYGFVPAVITGFLLTAIPNWTGRLPLHGAPLLGLVLVWAAGRIAVSVSGVLGWLPAAIIDGSFLLSS
jgi:uncharacterized protein involved in response to NO